MKKILGVLTIIVLLVSVCFYFFPKQPKNIFDEIYQETEKTYRSNNVLRHIDGFKIRPDWPSDDPNISQNPFGLYISKSNPQNFNNISIDFNFKNYSNELFVSFEKKISGDVKLWMISKYSQKTKMITKSIQIVLSGNEDSYIEDEAQVKTYLEKYGITAKDLDSYYDEIVNQKVLKDWCSIYDSKYSPSNYGDVKIKTQWENW